MVFNYDDVHLESSNLIEDFGLVVGLILTPSGPSFESIAMPNNLDEETKITREVLKV
jgi:hypothetical protein